MAHTAARQTGAARDYDFRVFTAATGCDYRTRSGAHRRDTARRGPALLSAPAGRSAEAPEKASGSLAALRPKPGFDRAAQDPAAPAGSLVAMRWAAGQRRMAGSC